MKYALVKYALAVLTSLAVSSNTNAASISAVAVDTPFLPGFKTVTLSVGTEAGESFRGFSAIFTGPMNQVNVFGIPTIFQDANFLFTAACCLEHDSQFLFNSGDILSIPGDAQEGANLLRATVSGLAALDLPNPAPFVQLVMPVGTGSLGADIHVEFTADVGLPEPLRFSGSLAPVCPVSFCPEPSTLILAGLGMIGIVGARRRG